METRLPAPCLVILIGPSSSGKSTWAGEHFEPGEVVSSDRLRGMVGIDENDQRASKSAFEILETIVTERVARKLTTVIDTLGFDDELRESWVDLARSAGLPVVGVTFGTEVSECMARNARRASPLPQGVIRKQATRFAKVVSELDGDRFDHLIEAVPVRVVAPQMTVASPLSDDSRDRPPPAHTFGLILSRFNWVQDERPLAESIANMAERAEAAGFRDLWLMDHFRQVPQVGRVWEDIPEPYTTLAYLAGKTSTIRLGAMVTAVTHRHPAVLGQILATLDVLSAGRAICGIGVAWDESEHESYGIPFPPATERYDMLEDTLEMLPLLWGKGSPAFGGRVWEARELTCYPRPIQERIPILVGGSGEKRTLPLTAKHADGCNFSGNPSKIKRKVEVLEGLCESIGRDPTEIEVSHILTTMVSADVASQRSEIDGLRGRNQSPADFARANNAGLADDIVDLVSHYHDAGATHSVVGLPNVALDGGIENFGRVIERFARTD